MTTTHSIAELRLTPAAYDEVKRAFEAAGYQHAFMADGMIDMSGVGVTRAPNRPAIFAEMRTVTTDADGGQTTQVLVGGRAIVARSCATCFDQPVPALACPSCRGSGDPCRPWTDAR